MSGEVNDISSIYREFGQLFNRSNCPDLFKAIDRVSLLPSNTHFPHPLGHFAILYTPIPYASRPEVMLLGNNPSWFVDVAANRNLSLKQKTEAERIVVEMGKGIPSVNSYVEHEHRFAKRIRKIFADAGLTHMLPNVVGMNWFWVQTGSNPYELNDVRLDDPEADKRKTEQLNFLIDYCREKTGEIINMIEPKNLFVLGNDAQCELPQMNINEDNIRVICAKHPDRSADLQRHLESIT